MAWNKETVVMEGVVQWCSAKAFLIEMTLGGRYWVPKKCITEMDRSGMETYLFEISMWWYNKLDDFDADVERD